MSYSKLALVINRLRPAAVNGQTIGSKLPERITEIREKTKADLVIGLPDDDEVAAFSEVNRSFLEISDSNPVYGKIGELIG